ncbi:MAG: hypothetical protein LC797_24000 [Chloroflexi bacterium]|nr:hypothetical protein [Chloroflexota bacterium]
MTRASICSTAVDLEVQAQRFATTDGEVHAIDAVVRVEADRQRVAAIQNVHQIISLEFHDVDVFERARGVQDRVKDVLGARSVSTQMETVLVMPDEIAHWPAVVDGRRTAGRGSLRAAGAARAAGVIANSSAPFARRAANACLRIGI